MEEAETILVQLGSVMIRQIDEQLANPVKRDLLQLSFCWLYTFPMSSVRDRVPLLIQVLSNY